MPLQNTQLAQVALVVRDIEESKKRWAELLGCPIPPTIVTDPGDKVRMRYLGNESTSQAKLAFFPLGPVQFELIEPIGGNSTWDEALTSQGESVHHLAFWTEDMAEDARVLEASGAPLQQRGDMGETGQYAYFDGREKFGVVLELLESKKKADVGV